MMYCVLLCEVLVLEVRSVKNGKVLALDLIVALVQNGKVLALDCGISLVTCEQMIML